MPPVTHVTRLGENATCSNETSMLRVEDYQRWLWLWGRRLWWMWVRLVLRQCYILCATSQWIL
ncbi:hypothetical protein PR001_g34043, partial [Phytophthora rubi]